SARRAGPTADLASGGVAIQESAAHAGHPERRPTDHAPDHARRVRGVRSRSRADAGVDEGPLDGSPPRLEAPEAFGAEVAAAVVECRATLLARATDCSPEQEIVREARPAPRVPGAVLVDHRPVAREEDGARDRGTAVVDEVQSTAPDADQSLPEQAEEASWLRRNAEPTSRLEVKAVVRLRHLALGVGPAHRERAALSGANVTALPLLEAAEEHVLVGVQRQRVDHCARRRGASSRDDTAQLDGVEAELSARRI